MYSPGTFGLKFNTSPIKESSVSGSTKSTLTLPAVVIIPIVPSFVLLVNNANVAPISEARQSKIANVAVINAFIFILVLDHV